MNPLHLALVIAGAAISLAACDEHARPITGATEFRVFVDDDTRLGDELHGKYGETPVLWCGDKPANWCSKKFARSVVEPAAVEALVGFVNQRTDGYREPWTGTPIPKVVTKFYNANGQLVGTFGSGSNFFARGGFPEERIKQASPNDLAQYISLIGLAPSDAEVVDRQRNAEATRAPAVN